MKRLGVLTALCCLVLYLAAYIGAAFGSGGESYPGLLRVGRNDDTLQYISDGSDRQVWVQAGSPVPGPGGTVRCYPKYTAWGTDPDRADMATYVWKEYNDRPVDPEFGVNYATYLTRFPIADATGTTDNANQVDSGAYCNYFDPTDYRWANYYVDIQWDFTPVPPDATILSSTLHYKIYAWIGGYAWWLYSSFGSKFNGVSLPAQARTETLESDIDVGTSWLGGSEPWITFRGDAGIQDPSTMVDKDCFTRFYLGWGDFSAGECTYIDVTYTMVYPPSGPVVDAPDAMFETWKRSLTSTDPLWYQAIPSLLKLLFIGGILLMAVFALRSGPRREESQDSEEWR